MKEINNAKKPIYIAYTFVICECSSSSSSSKFIRTKATKVNIHTNGQKRADPMGHVSICSLVPIRWQKNE